MPPRHYTNPARWTPRTLEDDYRERGEGSPDYIGCGRCRRQRVPAFAMVDVRALPASIRGDAEYVCDGCWTGWIRTQVITKLAWLEMLGAPAELVEQQRARTHQHLP